MMSSCKEFDKCIKIKTDIFYYNFLLPLHVVPLSLCRCSSEAEQLIRNQLAGSSTLPTGSSKIKGLDSFRGSYNDFLKTDYTVVLLWKLVKESAYLLLMAL
jgi:hypothetical protein